MERSVTVAFVQAEPVVLDCAATREGAELVVFPERFVSAYPSSRWARFRLDLARPV